MTVTLELKPETERGLLTQARERGVTLDAYLQQVLSELASVNNAAEVERGKLVDIPLLHLGVISPLRRADIYDDLDNAR